MIEFDLVEPPGRQRLPLDLRVTRGQVTDAPQRLVDLVTLGAPAIRRLTPDTATGDDDLRGFLSAEAASANYWLLQFTCTFDHDDKLPFTKAWLQLTLASDGGEAVAHSMEPVKLTGNRVVTWSAKLTIPCVFAQLELGLGGQVSTEEISCEASKEGTATPVWRYFRTSNGPIRGLQRMRLVGRTPASGGLAATVRVGATAEHGRFGLKPLSYDTPPDAGRHWLVEPAPDATRI
jgi:hypothetical protein